MKAEIQEHPLSRPDQVVRRVDGVMVVLWSFVVFCFASFAYVLYSLAAKCGGN
jgi:hypothetical protein